MLFQVGCSREWWPDTYPVPVAVLGETSPAERREMAARVAEWEAAVGRDLFELSFEPRGLSDCGRVNVWVRDGMGDGYGELTPTECSLFLEIRRPTAAELERWGHSEFGRVFAHELGHVLLGREHSSEPGSVRHDPIEPWAIVTDDDVSAVRATLGE
ncbi:MAG TPA: hypothetical protein VD838_09725 [Anaeromyxobacteraceae bacterium]|nr:hypothetical protein [Anaeromyxobacteraceae bacterium]